MESIVNGFKRQTKGFCSNYTHSKSFEFAYIFFFFPSNLLTFKLYLCSVVFIIKSLRTLMWPFETFCSALG